MFEGPRRRHCRGAERWISRVSLVSLVSHFPRPRFVAPTIADALRPEFRSRKASKKWNCDATEISSPLVAESRRARQTMDEGLRREPARGATQVRTRSTPVLNPLRRLRRRPSASSWSATGTG